MPRATIVQGESPPEGVATIPAALAFNVRTYRLMSRLEQEDVALQMQHLGHTWRRATVSEVERARRNVTVSELLALVLVLGATVEQLLDTRGPRGPSGPQLALAVSRVRYHGGPAEDTLVTEVSGLGPDSWTAVPVEDVPALLSGRVPRFNANWDRKTNELRDILFDPGQDDEGES